MGSLHSFSLNCSLSRPNPTIRRYKLAIARLSSFLPNPRLEPDFPATLSSTAILIPACLSAPAVRTIHSFLKHFLNNPTEQSAVLSQTIQLMPYFTHFLPMLTEHGSLSLKFQHPLPLVPHYTHTAFPFQMADFQCPSLKSRKLSPTDFWALARVLFGFTSYLLQRSPIKIQNAKVPLLNPIATNLLADYKRTINTISTFPDPFPS